MSNISSWFYPITELTLGGQIKQKMEKPACCKVNHVFSDMPSMSYFTEYHALGKVSEKGKNDVRQTDCLRGCGAVRGRR